MGLLAACAADFSALPSARGAAWPQRTIKVIVGGAPGSVPDALARKIASLPALTAAPDIVVVADRAGQNIAEVAATYFAAETFFRLDGPPFRLPPRDPALYFVQRLRDEAHRFAIGAHRAKRKREMAKNPLDEIPGIGPNRKRALLHHFGTVKAIQRAALEDLIKAPGVNAATARAVYDFFHA